MMTPKLTIGMAHYEDFDGVYFTLQALRLYHETKHCEIIVVDNSPSTAAGKAVKSLVEGWGSKKTAGARYIPMTASTGTSQPRNRIFEEATAPAVMVIDCHVLLDVNALSELIYYYEEHSETRDLLSGPMLYDDLEQVATHFDPVWRSEMWGIWGSDPRGLDPFGKPFEILGMGLGLFSCRKEAWLGFNPHFRGFGGEELYIHQKYRNAGAKCLCLPFLRWNHRFGRPGGVKYPLTRWNKVRNYVLGHQELGLDVKLIHEHFVGGKLFSQAAWDYLLADPVNHIEPYQPTAIAGPKARAQPVDGLTLEQLVKFVKIHERDLDQHADVIIEHVKKVNRVTAFVKRREWTPIIAAGRPEKIVMHQKEYDQLSLSVGEAIQKERLEQKSGRVTGTWLFYRDLNACPKHSLPIAETDMLCIDGVMHADDLLYTLEKHGRQSQRFIVLQGTGSFGEKAEDGKGPGLNVAVRKFMSNHPEWFVTYRSAAQYGLTILSRDAELDPPMDRGPGTQLHHIWKSLGIEPASSCECRRRAAEMDAWGIEGTRQIREEVIAWMREGQDKWGWREKLKAAGLAVTSGLAFKLNPLDPFPGIVDEAIRRAEELEAKWGKSDG